MFVQEYSADAKVVNIADQISYAGASVAIEQAAERRSVRYVETEELELMANHHLCWLAAKGYLAPEDHEVVSTADPSTHCSALVAS